MNIEPKLRPDMRILSETDVILGLGKASLLELDTIGLFVRVSYPALVSVLWAEKELGRNLSLFRGSDPMSISP